MPGSFEKRAGRTSPAIKATQPGVLASFREETRNLSADYFETPAFRKRCTSGKIRVVMSPSGNIYPCEKLGYLNLAEMEACNMGNVREFDYDINALVRSDKARAIYGRIQDGRCHCDHNIDQSLSLLSTQAFRNKVVGKALRTLLPRPAA